LWLYVDAIREFCGFFARATFDDSDVGERVGIVVHELVENAIRYGDDIELELRVEREGDAMLVVVANTAPTERIDHLKRVVADLNGLEPREGYLRALQDAAQRSSGLSGLGLPRVRYEGKVTIQLSTEPDRVTVTARGMT
jgi:hypothetical protein